MEIYPSNSEKTEGTWRDFDSLLPDSSDLAPATLQNALRLSGNIVASLPDSVLVLGNEIHSSKLQM